MARVFVATLSGDAQTIAGFFTLNAAGVDCNDLPAALAKHLPRYPVPVALIGRLAVAQQFQGAGLGSILLIDACKKALAASAVLAIAGIVADAKDLSAHAFYAHMGFAPLQGSSSRLLLPMKAITRLCQ